ncbi:MAG: cytochrome ubiquinol oxidase subunit I [Heliobacteriaceae bacterium]|nr:cytochrome ubiquinol oxidase subunit I [Heliobacteriaceae bacterium]
MDVVTLSKIQFAMSIGFHYIFPPLTIGLAWLIVIMLSLHWKTKNEIYAKMAYFWIRLFAVSFVVGVVTGVVMEFQFGTNWSEYSRFVGDVFGAPLAAEGIYAFFLESVFVGVLIWGRHRVSNFFYWFSSLMVAFGSTLSAFWIIVANSWMQTPAGFAIVNGRAEMTDFLAAVFNPSTIPRYFHTVDGALITGAFFMMGISAWFLLKDREVTFARRSLKIALITACVVSVIQLGFGHSHAVQVAETQPVKMAAFEGLFETEKGAPLLLFGIPDREGETTHLAVGLPKMLSFLVAGDFGAEVKGLNEFPQNQWPPLGVVFQSYHLMILLGSIFVFVTAGGMYLLFRKELFGSRRFLKLLLYAVPLPFICNEAGWIAAEVGRQPWIVYNVMETNAAASFVVPAGQIVLSIAMFTVIYVILFAVWVFLLRRNMGRGFDRVDAHHHQEVTAV